MKFSRTWNNIEVDHIYYPKYYLLAIQKILSYEQLKLKFSRTWNNIEVVMWSLFYRVFFCIDRTRYWIHHTSRGERNKASLIRKCISTRLTPKPYPIVRYTKPKHGNQSNQNMDNFHFHPCTICESQAHPINYQIFTESHQLSET